ncbi:MAG: ankyrin repeat domain-containing protein [Isosphaeraceae bacterium]|jgi:ankyrin repeat protein
MPKERLPYNYKGLAFASATEGFHRLLASLLEKGLEPDLRNALGQTPLMVASLNGQLECVKLLITKGANPNSQDNELTTPLMYACHTYESLEVARILVRMGAQVDVQDKFGRTALMVASSNGLLDSVNILLSNSADPNIASANQETALTFAIVWNHPLVVKSLVESGANLGWKDSKGWTPLKYSIYQGNDSICEYLSSRGARAS